MFREHVATGAVISTAVCVAVYSYALVTDPILLLFLFGVTVIGSFLPDVDSDSGIPFYLVFGTASLAATGIVALYTIGSSYASDWRYLIGIPAGALFFFWFVVGAIIKKCTKHRGMFHSLPALLIASTATFLVAREYGLTEMIALVFAGAMGFGFLSHLVLDELYSEITLDGIPFNTKESAGTAMKWYSKRRSANIAAYLILAALLFTVFQPQDAFAFYNDSDVIEIEGTAPPPPEPSPPDDPGPQEDGGAASSGGDTGSTPSGGSGGSSYGGGSGGGTSSDTPDSTDDTTDDATLLDTLIAEGVITGSGAITGSSVFESSSSGGGTVRVEGAAVRRALNGKFELYDLLTGWRTSTQARLSLQGLGLVAASTALRDRNIDTVSFSAERFDIRYRSRGYLFSLFPMSFPVRVTVIPEATSGRVTVTLPWYRFFVREFFTAKTLTTDIDTLIEAIIESNVTASADLRATMFTAVTDYLRSKVGTVTNTIEAN